MKEGPNEWEGGWVEWKSVTGRGVRKDLGWTPPAPEGRAGSIVQTNGVKEGLNEGEGGMETGAGNRDGEI